MKDAQLAKQHPAANSKAYWVRRQWEELRRGISATGVFTERAVVCAACLAARRSGPTPCPLRPARSACCLLAPPCLQVALSKLVLKRFLLLVALLDRAAQLPALPGGAPLLFRVDAKLKASAQVGWQPAGGLAGIGGALAMVRQGVAASWSCAAPWPPACGPALPA